MNITRTLLLTAFGLAVVYIPVWIKTRPSPGPTSPPAASSHPEPAVDQKKQPALSEEKDDDEAHIRRIPVEELKIIINSRKPVFIIDARSAPSYDKSDEKIRGAVRIPYNEIESHLKHIPRDKEIVIYCA
jgi:hypothetical protein